MWPILLLMPISVTAMMHEPPVGPNTCKGYVTEIATYVDEEMVPMTTRTYETCTNVMKLFKCTKMVTTYVPVPVNKTGPIEIETIVCCEGYKQEELSCVFDPEYHKLKQSSVNYIPIITIIGTVIVIAAIIMAVLLFFIIRRSRNNGIVLEREFNQRLERQRNTTDNHGESSTDVAEPPPPYEPERVDVHSTQFVKFTKRDHPLLKPPPYKELAEDPSCGASGSGAASYSGDGGSIPGPSTSNSAYIPDSSAESCNKHDTSDAISIQPDSSEIPSEESRGARSLGDLQDDQPREHSRTEDSQSMSANNPFLEDVQRSMSINDMAGQI